MNNLSSYCGLVDAKIRGSDKDLPVWRNIFIIIWSKLQSCPSSSFSCVVSAHFAQGLDEIVWFGGHPVLNSSRAHSKNEGT